MKKKRKEEKGNEWKENGRNGEKSKGKLNGEKREEMKGRKGEMETKVRKIRKR